MSQLDWREIPGCGPDCGPAAEPEATVEQAADSEKSAASEWGLDA
jgi:hypothetical protein